MPTAAPQHHHDSAVDSSHSLSLLSLTALMVSEALSGVLAPLALAVAGAAVVYTIAVFISNNFLGGLVRDNEPPRTSARAPALAPLSALRRRAHAGAVRLCARSFRARLELHRARCSKQLAVRLDRCPAFARSCICSALLRALPCSGTPTLPPCSTPPSRSMLCAPTWLMLRYTRCPRCPACGVFDPRPPCSPAHLSAPSVRRLAPV